MRSENRMASFLNGAGFYIVLFLAIAVIVISGYFIYRTLFGGAAPENQLPSEGQLSQQQQQQPEHMVPDVELHEDIPSPRDDSVTATVPVSGTAQVPADKQPSAPADAARSAGAQEEDTRIVLPLTGETVTPYSMKELLYNATMDDWRTHDGIDIAAEEGSSVAAAAAGKVTAVTDDYWMGTTVTIQCAGGYELTYASLQSGPRVSVGDTVRPGDIIGAVGSTSLLEGSEAHLHFSVAQGGVSTDPEVYLSKAG